MDAEKIEIKKKIEEFARKIYEEFEKGNPSFKFIIRGNLKYVEYDPTKDLIKLKKSYGYREFFNLGHTRKFTQTILIAALAKKLISENRTASLREVFYQLRHTIPIINEDTFYEQKESDSVIEDLERTLNIIREKIHIKADRRGYVYGNITMRDRSRGDEWNCSKLGMGGWGVPSTIEEIEILDINADFVLVVEKDALFERLIEERFPEKHKAILISAKGQASRGVRRLIHRLRYEHNLPVYVFTDGDPWGYYIYSVIKRGSMKLSHFSELLATPDVKFVGMTMDDVDEYDLKRVTIKLTARDEKRIKELMEYPWFKKNRNWQRQFNKMLNKKIKIEQDALAAKSLEFVAEKYLPEKLSNPDKLLS
ncbi:DNA topoisomerase IV subunit A [Nanoarchaeota archaeon NZ13-N]|nr:MAG: DNA topoisomerase IV subunit A [Nanoarchaeota archaeon NZ13-N]